MRLPRQKRGLPPSAPSKRRKRGVSTFLQGDMTLTDKAYAQIEELIVTLQLPPGTVLSELVLADRLGIGRTPIREALQRLSRDGLVNILPRRGVLVSEIDLRSQLRLLEVRRELERLMARGAAERASDEERAQFSEIAQRHASRVREGGRHLFHAARPAVQHAGLACRAQRISPAARWA